MCNNYEIAKVSKRLSIRSSDNQRGNTDFFETNLFLDIEKVECTYSNTAEVQQAIKELKIKTNSKFSVCSTQGSFDKQSIYICLFMYQSVCLSVYLSVDLSIYISIHPSICLSVCLSIYLQ